MGYLSWSVPMMAYALVTGSSYAMVGDISSMDSAGKSAANAAGPGIRNPNFGNVSTNNLSFNDVAGDNRSMRNNSHDNNSAYNTSRHNTSLDGYSKGGVSESIDGGRGTATGTFIPGTDPANFKNESARQVAAQMANGTITDGSKTYGVTGGKIMSETDKLQGGANQTFAGMNVSGLSGDISKTGSQVSAKGLTGSKASLENFVKEHDPKALGKAEQFLSKNPNSVLSFTSGNGKMDSLDLKSSFNADHVDLMKDTTGSQKAKYNSSLIDDSHTKTSLNSNISGNYTRTGKYAQGYVNATSLQVGDTATGSTIMQAAMGNKQAFNRLQQLSKGRPGLKTAIGKAYAGDINSLGHKTVSSATKKAMSKSADKNTKIDHNTQAGWVADLNIGSGIVLGAAAVAGTDLATGGAGVPADALIYTGAVAGVNYGLKAIEGKIGGGVKYSKNTSFDRSHGTGTGQSVNTGSGVDISKNASFVGAYNSFQNGTQYNLPNPKAVSFKKGTFKPLNNPLSVGGIVKNASSKIFHGIGIDPMSMQNNAYNGEYIPPSPSGSMGGANGSLPKLSGANGVPQLSYKPELEYNPGVELLP